MKRPHNKYNGYKVLEILTLYHQGHSPTEIAKKLSTYNTTIRRVLLRHSKSLQNQSEAQKIVKGNPFISSDYWTGFIAGDGNIYHTRIKVGLARKDLTHLQKYKKFLGVDIKITTEKNGYGWESRVVAFKSKSVATWFKSFGITPNKSKTLAVPFKTYTPSFVRGLMDADGHIKKLDNGRLAVEIGTASVSCKTDLIKYFKYNGIKSTWSKPSSLYIIRVCTQKEVFKLWVLLYSNAQWYLTRKAKSFLHGSLIQKWISENIPNSGNPKTVKGYGDPELARVFKALGKCNDFTGYTLKGEEKV